jgi:hypothetical protein
MYRLPLLFRGSMVEFRKSLEETVGFRGRNNYILGKYR